MHAQDQNAKCVDSAQHEGSIPHEGFSASASADFRNQFGARSTADHIIASIDLSESGDTKEEFRQRVVTTELPGQRVAYHYLT